MVLRKIKLFALAVAVMMLAAACSSSSGKVTDGVYQNKYFKVTTPEGLHCYTGDSVKKAPNYDVLYINSAQRNAEKTFFCDYAAANLTTEIIVAGEKNVNKLTLDQFAALIEKGTNSSLFDIEVVENQDITVDGVKFRHLKVVFWGDVTRSEYFIQQQGDKFIYVFIEYQENDKTGISDAVLNCISAP